MEPVIQLDPRAANDALAKQGDPAPDDGFFMPVTYRGAFDAANNWLIGWTAADAYGMLVAPPSCPWDCGTPSDGQVGVVDFLAILAQWGQVGTPCDFDGAGVGVTDFLALLANWGPCP